MQGREQQCSSSCGSGVQKRELRCSERDTRGGFTELPSRRCRHTAKPLNLDLQQLCNPGACPEPAHISPGRGPSTMVSGWFSSPWQQCSVSCGGGVQTRGVQCLRQGRPTAGCLLHQRPVTSRACNTHFCPAARPVPAHRPPWVTAAAPPRKGKP
uniref:Uncharacterized protein n=1 Tax=Knipowitschia caucasica TaxID=637954 RepID=A0AAV2LQH2_KNICA